MSHRIGHEMFGSARSAWGGMILAASLPWAALPLVAHAQETKVVVAQSADVPTLDPTATTSSLGINVYQNVFDHLTTIAADGSVTPRLGEKWDIADKAKVWTFKIRNGVKFHDGSPLTVDDVIWTYQKVMADAKSPVKPYLKMVKSIDKVGTDSVRFTLDESFITFDRQVSLVSILPQKAYERLGAEKFSLQPVGSGAFKVVQWVKDGYLELAANPDFWGGAPKVGKVVFRPVPSEPARAAGLASGELDIVPLLPPTLVASLATRPNIKVEKVGSNRTIFLGYNPANPQLANLKLRQAIDHAIDRDAIATKLLRGLGKPVGQIPAPVLFGYDPSVAPTRYDPELAKKLVAESGYKGEKIVFQYPNNRWAFAEEVAQAVGGYLKTVGIQAELQSMEFSAFFPLWLGNKLGSMYMFSLGITVMDADLILNLEYESGSSHGYWVNAEVDALAKQQRAETNPQVRKEILGRIWRMSQQNAWFAPLYQEIQAYGISDRVKWAPRPDERLNFENVEVVAKK